jgi:hypothetical protein
MSRRCREMEDGREVCLEEEVERLRRSGMSAAEISRTMGLDQSWVENLVVRVSDEDDPGATHEQDRG